jgi:hypothetical protein
MQITTTQMHNVIDCFCRRLSKDRGSEKADGGSGRPVLDDVGVAPEISRRAAMNKISAQVLHTITQAGELVGGLLPDPPAADEAEDDPVGEATPPAESSFTFNVIDAINRKQTATLAAGDAGALIKRLGQLAERRRSRTTESWG